MPMAKVPSGSHRGSRWSGWWAAPRAASSRGGRCTRIATEAPAIRNGTIRSNDPGGVSRSRAAPLIPPRTAAIASGRSRRACPLQLRAGGAHRADAVEHERDGVGDVRGDRREAGGQQRRVADQRGQSGDAAGETRTDPGEDEEAELEDAHRVSSTMIATRPRTTIAVRRTRRHVRHALRASHARAPTSEPLQQPVDRRHSRPRSGGHLHAAVIRIGRGRHRIVRRSR